MSFSIKKDGEVVVVDVEGQLIVGNRQELKQKVLDELEKGEKKFLIDFSQTGYIDSSGLGVLVVSSELEELVHISTRILVMRDGEIVAEVDGKDAKVTFVEVTIEPGQSGLPHRHPGPGFVYVLEGEYELGIDDQPTKVLKAGETFYEPGGCLHRVTRNPGKVRARVLAWVLHPRDAKEFVIPVRQ